MAPVPSVAALPSWRLFLLPISALCAQWRISLVCRRAGTFGGASDPAPFLLSLDADFSGSLPSTLKSRVTSVTPRLYAHLVWNIMTGPRMPTNFRYSVVFPYGDESRDCLFCTLTFHVIGLGALPLLSMEVPTGLDWKASVREWLIGLDLPPTNDFGPLQAVEPSTEGCPATSAQVVIASRVYPVPHTSSAPSEVAVPPMRPTLDRLKALANSLSSYPPSSLFHNSDPMLSRASLGLGLGMHTVSVPYIPTSVSSSTSVSYPASALYSSSLVFTPDHNQNAFTTPLQGPSLSRRISGPVFPLAPALGLNGLFLSSNPLENVLVGDIYCLHAHLAIHRLSPQGFGVSFTVYIPSPTQKA
ncbi:hypothetical protein B0H13DRAFT_1856256 [Mycena leptocephala]|nr:hypothetical protein B0H13DRAFT_1856256 [Mycena leptocephala]